MSLQSLLLILAAAVVHAVWNLAVLQARGHIIVVWSGLWIGALVLLPICSAGGFIGGIPLSGAVEPGILCALLSGLIHAIYFSLLGVAYGHGEISVVYPVARGSAVALIALLASRFLNEDISFSGSIGIALVCVGVFFSGWRQGSSIHGWLWALPVGLSTAGYSLVDKVGVGHMHPIFYILITWLTAAIILTPFIWFTRRGHIREDYGKHHLSAWIFGIGSIGAYLLVLLAMRLAQVSYVAAVREVAIVFGAVGGFLYFGESATKMKLAGLTAIVVGCVLIKIG